MPKFVLQPNPTFKLPVDIPVAGNSAKSQIVFIFKHKTRTQLEELKSRADAISESVEGNATTAEKTEKMVELVLDIATGWDLEEHAFNAENLQTLFENYLGAPAAIVRTYILELSGVRLGN